VALTRLLRVVLIVLSLSLAVIVRSLAAGPAAPAAEGSALAPQAPSFPRIAGITMIPGTMALGVTAEAVVQDVLSRSNAVLPPADYFAVTAVSGTDEWQFVSVAGLEGLRSDLEWNLQKHAVWFGLVLLRRDAGGSWTGATEGTAEFSLLLDEIPAEILDASARQNIDPISRAAAPAATYRFPWESNTCMQYGSRGLHPADFEGWGGIYGWKAVDFLSDGSVSSGRAPNRLLAAAAGTIGAVCNDGTSVAIRVGDLLYAHLLNNANLYTGKTFAQGAEIGQLRPNSFNARCGWATQSPGWFHVHWGFPATAPFRVEDWTLDLSDGLWRRGSETRGTGWCFTAGGVPTPTPAPGGYRALFPMFSGAKER